MHAIALVENISPAINTFADGLNSRPLAIFFTSPVIRAILLIAVITRKGHHISENRSTVNYIPAMLNLFWGRASNF